MPREFGELFGEPVEMRCEWRISDITSLPEEPDEFYPSPEFLFSDACWCLAIYRHKDPEKVKEGWVELFLSRLDCGPPKTVSFSFGFKKTDDKEHTYVMGETTFTMEESLWGATNFLQFSDFLNRKTELAPLDAITVTCTLKSVAHQNMGSSLFRRLWNLSLSLKHILNTPTRTDLELKLNDGEIPVHRIILESRSAVLNRMLDIDIREKQTDEMNIEDEQKGMFKVVLSYLYSGDPEGLCTENVRDIFFAAHEYHLEELAKLCVDFMQKGLTVDTVCDFIGLALTWGEMSLKECAKKYFVKHKTEVFKSANWEKIKMKNPTLGFRLMEYVFGE